VRIGLISDSHSSVPSVRRALAAMGQVDLLVHLGDGAGDLARTGLVLPKVIQIKGNCDTGDTYNPEESIHLDAQNKAIFCHGNTWNVKWGLLNLSCHAQEEEATLVCFGHTHRPCIEYAGRVTLVNPGSCKGPDGTCAVITFEDGLYRPEIIKL